MDKFQEAICAFANDLPGKRQKGYLLIGVDDSGRVSELKQHIILLINSLYGESLAISELKHKPKLKPFIGDKSNAYIMKFVVRPAISHGWISMTYPENPRHPNQKYFLTDLGKGLLEWLRKG